MANISKIKLPNGTTYNVTDSGALPLTGGTVTGPVTFNGGVELNYFTSHHQSGSGFYIIDQGWNDEQGIFVGYNDSGTSYGLEVVEVDGVGHVGLYGLRDPGSPSDAANKRYVDAAIPDISGKADKSAAVSTITYDSTNKKLTKTINGTTSDVVTVATLKTALGSMPASDVYSWAKASSKPSYSYSEITGTVPSSALPSYVDDVLEYTAKANFPTTGETGKIYVDTATNITYRWGGSNYIEISPSLALGTTSSTAFRGDYGNTAYAHATDANRLTTAKTSGLYKIAVTAHGHVQSVTAVAKADITGLGIPAQDTTYSSKAAANGGTDVSLVTTGEKYTWNNKISASNPTIATDTGTSSITLAHGGKYKLTAGGGSIIFTMPSDANTWRGIQDNLTSSSNTTESLSAKQGYLLANGSARDSTKLPLTGGIMTGAITFNKVNDAIKYTGSQATYSMIKFKDNTGDTYGNGIIIGGGGLTVIGGGESADTVAAQFSSGGDETMYVTSDGAAYVLTNLQSGWDNRKTFTFGTDGSLTATTFIGALSGNATTATTASKLGSSTVGSARQAIYLNAGTATAGNYTVAHFGSAGKANMNDIGRLHASVGMTNLTDPSNNTDNPMSGTTKSTSWHLYWDANYIDDPNGSNAWVAQIVNKAGTAQWWVRSRAGGTITNGTAWAADWKHLVVAPQAGQGSATVPIYIDANGHTQSITSYGGNAATATKATYDANNLRIDTGYLKLTGGSVTGPTTFGDSVSIDDLTAGQLVVSGGASVANNLQVNTINGVTVGSSPKFTDTTYSSQAAASGGTAVSLVTTGEKYTWNSKAAGSHAHGNITSGGDITATATIASGDRLVINDESASKLINSSITFGTSTTQFLANNGTWQTPASGSSVITRTVTLAANGWSSGAQTVTVSGVTSSNNVIVSSAPSSYQAYISAGIYCSAQGSNSLTFTCMTTPSSALTVNVLILG